MSIEYRPDFGLYWPDWDKKAEQNHSYILKHLPDMDKAIGLCRQKKVAIQAGGHAGLWPKRLAGHFQFVYTFEPEQDLFGCLVRNAPEENVYKSFACLGDEIGTAYLKRSGSSGSNRIKDQGVAVRQTTIDALSLQACDAIFLDVEHYELQALKGAVETLQRFRPIIQVEELDPNDGVHAFLRQFGYQSVGKAGKDRIYQCKA